MISTSKTTGANILIALSFFVCWIPAHGENGVEVRPTTAHLKKHLTDHLVIYYSREFHADVDQLAASAELFLTDLATRWSVILPDRKIPITLGTQEPQGQTWAHFEAPFWIHSHYDRNYRRIELAVTRPLKYDGEIVSDALEHHLVHYLLNLKPGNRLPAFLEEGLAQYYGRPARSRDRYLAIWGCFRQDDLQAFLWNEHTFESPYSYYSGAALSRLLVAWMWQENPAGETQFLQSFLRGLPWEDALTGAGFRNVEALFPNFELDIRPNHQIYHIFLTFDFWVIALGILSLLYMGFKLVVAFRMARTPYVQVGNLAAVEENLPPVTEFSGPAFSAPEAALSAAIPGSQSFASAEEVTGLNPFADLDEDLDAVFNQLDNPFDEIDGELDHLFEGFGGGEQTPTNVKTVASDRVAIADQARTPAAAKTSGPLMPEEDIDDDIDRVFGDWTPKPDGGK